MIDNLFSPLYLTLIILIVSSAFFMSGKVRSDLVALCALLALMLTNVLEPSEALSGFSNSVVIMMIGLFIVGGGIFRTGLAKMISSKILQLAGNNENKLFLLVMLVTASIGAFVSNTGTVAVMMPIVISMAMEAKLSPRKFLMPLAFASSMGILTLISTAPNMVIQDILIKNGYPALSFFSFTPIGLIALSVGTFLLFFLRKFFLSDDEDSKISSKNGKTLQQLVEEYNISQTFHVLSVGKESGLVGKSLKELHIGNNYGVNITKISRTEKAGIFSKTVLELVATADTVILSGDSLNCSGTSEEIELFVKENDLQILITPSQLNGALLPNMQKIGLAEVFIMPSSRLINRTITDTNFREEYNVNIIGVQHNKEYITKDIQNLKLQSGDALLIQGTWSHIDAIGKTRQNDLVLVGQPLEEASKVTLDNKAPVAASIMFIMVVLMVFNIVPAVTAVLMAAVAMIVTGCLRNMQEAYSHINWESVVLIGAMLPMSLAFEKTGAAALISEGLVQNLGQYGPSVLLGGIYFVTSLLTLFISNTATAILLTPIALNAAQSMGVSPYPYLFAVTVAASMCFASPFSTPPNALVMSAGRYSFMDYVKVGLPMQIIIGIVMVLLLPTLCWLMGLE